MEGEIFAKNILDVKGSSSTQLGLSAAPPIGINDVDMSTENAQNGVSPRKPWEDVKFDPKLKPYDYQIEGCDCTISLNYVTNIDEPSTTRYPPGINNPDNGCKNL